MQLLPIGRHLPLAAAVTLLFATTAEARPARKVLMVLSSHDRLGPAPTRSLNRLLQRTRRPAPTGTWLQELTEPYEAFRAAGLEVEVASIKGGRAPLDPASREGRPEERLQADATLRSKVARSIPLSSISARDYDAIFLVGGHGAIWDFPDHPILAGIVDQIFERGGVVAAICHGVLGLTPRVVNGRAVTGFSDDEEVAEGLDGIVPLSTQGRLAAQGGRYTAAPVYEPHAITDGRLVTGQNPSSALAAARRLLRALAAD